MDAYFILESMWGNRSKGRVSLWVKETDIIPEVIDTLASVATDLKFRKLILLIDEHLYMKYLDRYPHEVISKEVILTQKLK
ncbi:MAG: hypothetical protein J7J20_02580 [Desulfurococcales archaeon]|nr:hypothetical protein [Desulfurococcales archaeon]